MRPESQEADTHSKTEELVDHVKAYVNTSFELFRLKAVDKASAVLASGLSQLIVVLLFVFVLLLVSIGSALWISTVLGSRYSGFFIVSAFYLLLGFLVYFSRDRLIKKPVSDKIIDELLND